MSQLSRLDTDVNNVYVADMRFPTLFSKDQKAMLVDVAMPKKIVVVPGSVLWYVGGNTNCVVGRQILDTNPEFKKMLVFEPMKDFVKVLKPVLEKRKEQIVIHNFGIGSKNFIAYVQNQGPSTTALNSACTESRTCHKIVVREINSVLQENSFVTSSAVDNMLYTNCEGCEIDLLEALLQSGLIKHFAYVHFATHYVDSTYVARLCNVRLLLSTTHDYLFGFPYAQERWKRKKNGH
ncbi:MAG: hypothetical protein V4628_15495 [Pseudomonadota bacterium]